MGLGGGGGDDIFCFPATVPSPIAPRGEISRSGHSPHFDNVLVACLGVLPERIRCGISHCTVLCERCLVLQHKDCYLGAQHLPIEAFVISCDRFLADVFGYMFSSPIAPSNSYRVKLYGVPPTTSIPFGGGRVYAFCAFPLERCLESLQGLRSGVIKAVSWHADCKANHFDATYPIGQAVAEFTKAVAVWVTLPINLYHDFDRSEGSARTGCLIPG